MAILYLRSTDGSDLDDGSTWANAKATLVGAFAVAIAGDTIYVSQNHAEAPGGNVTLTSPGTAASPCNIICVVDDAPPTTLATTATFIISVVDSNIRFLGVAYYYGIQFSTGTSQGGCDFWFGVSASAVNLTFEQCHLKMVATDSGSLMYFGVSGDGSPSSQRIILIDTDITLASVGQTLRTGMNVTLIWRGGSLLTLAPTTLFQQSNYYAHGGRVILDGVDLSVMGSGKSLALVTANGGMRYSFSNCKLGASVAITTGSIAGPQSIEVEVVNCDSADTNYRYYKETYQGEISQETTIVRTSGASDGTTPISRKLVSTANSTFFSPLELGPLAVWNETVGSSVTATVEIVTDGVTLTDAECWLEIEYLGTIDRPLSLFADDRAANILATPANQTASSVTWTTGFSESEVKQKLSVSFTPQEKGPIKARVMLARASTTVYVGPLIDIS